MKSFRKTQIRGSSPSLNPGRVKKMWTINIRGIQTLMFKTRIETLEYLERIKEVGSEGYFRIWDPMGKECLSGPIQGEIPDILYELCYAYTNSKDSERMKNAEALLDYAVRRMRS